MRRGKLTHQVPSELEENEEAYTYNSALPPPLQIKKLKKKTLDSTSSIVMGTLTSIYCIYLFIFYKFKKRVKSWYSMLLWWL